MPEQPLRSAVDSFDAIMLEQPRPALAPRGRIIAFRTAATRAQEQAERALVRRARRQGLLLMIGSSLLSLAVLYGVWTLLSHLVFRAS